MVSVRCPWCDSRMSEGDGGRLSYALMVHFVRTHGLVVPDDDLLRGGREGHLSTLAELPDGTGEQEVRYGAPRYGPELTRREGDLYGARGPPRTVTVQKGKEAPSVQCPLCGFPVQGRDEDDLTAELARHMRDNNELENDRRYLPAEKDTPFDREEGR